MTINETPIARRHAQRAAAPGGGAQKWVRGCALSFALIASVAGAQTADVPSGQPVTLVDAIVDQVGEQSLVRLRFVAPHIGRDADAVDAEVAAADMQHLCDAVALPYMAEYNLTADVIVISLMSAQTEFGTPNPDVTQFFEAYNVKNDLCIWDPF
mgnify:CR=1 FL=1